MEITAIGPRHPPSGSKTADSQAQTRTSKSPSYIPLFSPKATRNPAISSSLPSSLSVPHLGLVPPNRTPSGGGPLPQAPASPPSPSSTHVSGGTSLPSLRALRNFLPFSAAKPVSSTAVPGPSKNPFYSFTPGRRSSITIEHKNSGQFPRSPDDIDVAVISIAPTSQANADNITHHITPSADAQQPSHPSVPTWHGELGTFDRTGARCTTIAYFLLI
jgi:hypothetical protein